MSAYVNGRTASMISLAGSPNGVSTDTFDHVPPLPQIGSELEVYFTIAKQIEAALMHERSNLRKYKEELRELHLKHSRCANELEAREKDFTVREDQLKNQIASYLHSEKALNAQISELARKVDALQNEKSKLEVTAALMQANAENLKQREESLRNTLQSQQSSQKAHTESVDKLTKELNMVRTELNRYKAAWAQIVETDRKAKKTLQESSAAKRTVEELTEALSIEKKRREDLDELVKKERREKQLALSCLHTAESRLAQMTKQMEQNKEQAHQSVDHQLFELKF